MAKDANDSVWHSVGTSIKDMPASPQPSDEPAAQWGSNELDYALRLLGLHDLGRATSYVLIS